MSLVLKRRIGETVVINGPATITLMAGGRLKFDAPDSTRIMRGELAENPKISPTAVPEPSPQCVESGS